MARSAASSAREARRYRSTPTLRGRDEDCKTGHPALFVMRPAFQLGRQPEGGGYPVGFVELAARLLGCADVAAIVHVCSGSIDAPLTFDLRAGRGAACAHVAADARWLPIRPGSVRWILADPPFGADYAQELWGAGKQYPAPTVLLRECAGALAPGGRVGFMHHLVPVLPAGLELLGVHGVTTGPGYRIRAFTVAERSAAAPLPFEL